MAIYKPSLLDKFKDFVNGLRANWDEYENHVEDFELHKAESSNKHIAESGSNNDGYYIRFDDGTMICGCRHSVIRSIVANWGSGFAHAPVTITYPRPFSTFPSVGFGYSDPTGANFMAMVAGTFIDKSYCRASFVRPPDDVDRERVITCIAIGRWK